MDCHSRVSGPRGLGRRFSPSEVKTYKSNWESIIARKHSLNLIARQKWSSKEYDMLKVETSKIALEFAATEDSKRTRQLLEILDVYAIYAVDSRFILDQLHQIIPLLKGQKAQLLAEYATHYLAYLLISPSELRRKDVQTIDKVISILEWLGEWNAQMGNAVSVNKCLESMHHVFEITSLYNSQRFRSKIVRIIKKIDKTARSTEGLYEKREPIRTRAVLYLKRIKRTT